MKKQYIGGNCLKRGAWTVSRFKRGAWQKREGVFWGVGLIPNAHYESILFGPEALLQLREDMMLAIASLSVGCRNIVLLLSLER